MPKTWLARALVLVRSGASRGFPGRASARDAVVRSKVERNDRTGPAVTRTEGGARGGGISGLDGGLEESGR